jgi:hypothetical protein
MSLPHRLLALFLALTAAATAHAQPAASTYAGEVPVATQDEDERDSALGPALVNALVKASGDPGLRNEAQEVAQANAAGLLRQYSYRQVEESVDGKTEVRTLLVAQFDRAGVEDLLTQLGRAVWSGPRPPVLVWLLIDDGALKRIASDAQSSALGALTGAASERGLTLQFPRMDLEDTQRADPEALWSGPASSAAEATKRYATPYALIARLSRTATGWSGRFTLTDGSTGTDWTASGADSNTVLTAGANGLAERLMRRYSIAPEEREVADFRVAVAGLRSAADYGTVLEFLGNLPAVGAAVPEGADGERLLLKLTLNVSLERFRQMLALERVLEFDDTPPAEGQPQPEGVQATLRLVQR